MRLRDLLIIIWACFSLLVIWLASFEQVDSMVCWPVARDRLRAAGVAARSWLGLRLKLRADELFSTSPFIVTGLNS
jgi:hypothetical protein